jgi:type VI secretion system secreted protein VgrG
VAKDETITINGGRTEKVAKNEGVTIGEGRTVSVGKDDGLTVGKNLSISAGDSITITTGSASISMKKDGTITIKGKNITIDDGGKTNIKASGDIVMKASKILQN